ncbi:MAG: SDR family NAD(P)-dependent oxidoreductase [Defluviicoccus sp.]|nr:SDR family NAD(P)-dependent oxidoreductase [Defluviicoccus sp.]MDE0277185.1 SDR family NAD(P)-dependent oxidoreductase [Defluviicoccus sp.]
MTTKLPPPRPKDPTKRTRLPTRPPGNRSREAHGLTAMAAAGRFALQTCADCGTVQYPPRQVCGNCLGDRLQWRDVSDGGRLLAETTLAHSNDLFFRDRLPWRLGVVHADAGPSMVAHLAEDCIAGARVRLALSIDRAGNAVVTARPEHPTPNPEDDRQLREMTFDPKDRRVLIVDGKTELGLALVRAFAGAGARQVYVGHAQPWRRSPHLDAAREIDAATLFPLDVTDTDSVEELAATIGDKVEILVNNAYHLRMGGAVGRMDLNTAHDEMAIHYHGLLRLAGHFGPVMRARGADGAHGAAAWVNLLSAYAWANNPALGTYSASQAAALSLSHCLRAELAEGGVRVVNAFLGPIEDEWHQLAPPPKLDPAAAARRIVAGLKAGVEDIPIGAVAEEILARRAENPKEIERGIGL